MIQTHSRMITCDIFASVRLEPVISGCIPWCSEEIRNFEQNPVLPAMESGS